jgi:hypothetical protein
VTSRDVHGRSAAELAGHQGTRSHVVRWIHARERHLWRAFTSGTLSAKVVVVVRGRGGRRMPEPHVAMSGRNGARLAQLCQVRHISKKVSVGDSIRGDTLTECVAPDLNVSGLLMCVCAALCISSHRLLVPANRSALSPECHAA